MRKIEYSIYSIIKQKITEALKIILVFTGNFRKEWNYKSEG